MLILACGLAALVAAGCGGASTPGPAARLTPPSRQSLAATYLRIAVAGNHRLDHDFAALNAQDRHRFAAARADLRDISATEHLFDQRLAALAFPPRIQVTALRLISVNQARAALTRLAAASPSLAQLQGCLPRLSQASRPVETEVRTIRHQLGLPPPGTS